MQGETFSRKSFPLHPFQKALTKEEIGRAQTGCLFVGDGLLRFGHATVLTTHCVVIHYRAAASLPPGHPEK